MFKLQANENITSWFDRYTTIVNQLNQLGRVIPEDEMVKRLLMRSEERRVGERVCT